MLFSSVNQVCFPLSLKIFNCLDDSLANDPETKYDIYDPSSKDGWKAPDFFNVRFPALPLSKYAQVVIKCSSDAELNSFPMLAYKALVPGGFVIAKTSGLVLW